MSIERPQNRIGYIMLSALLHGAGLLVLGLGTYKMVETTAPATVEVKTPEAQVQPVNTSGTTGDQIATPPMAATAPAPAEKPTLPKVTASPRSARVSKKPVTPPVSNGSENQLDQQAPKEVEADAADMKAIQSGKVEVEEVDKKEDPNLQRQNENETAPADKLAATNREAEEAKEETQAPVAPVAQPETKAEIKAVEPVAAAPAKTESPKAEVAAETKSALKTGDSGDQAAVNAALAGQAVPQGVEIKESTQIKAKIGNPNPRYPEDDRIHRRQGRVVVVGEIKKDGTIGALYVEQTSGSKSLDKASLETFKKWKFEPGQEGFVRKPFEYRLSGNASDQGGGRLRN